MSVNGENYTAGKNFTLPPALTALTNSTSAYNLMLYEDFALLTVFPKYLQMNVDY